MKKASHSLRGLLAGITGSLLILHTALGAPKALSPQEMRGKQIYLEGTSVRMSQLQANVGAESVVLPANVVPCANCHGPDGLGRPEGGVIPPDIRWSQLTKPYGHVHENGRRHPAFDEKGFAKLVRLGLDPADNRLDQTMPTYTIPDPDMQDTGAYK